MLVFRHACYHQNGHCVLLPQHAMGKPLQQSSSARAMSWYWQWIWATGYSCTNQILIWEEVGQKEIRVRQEDGRTLLPSNTENSKRLEFAIGKCTGCNFVFFSLKKTPPPFMTSCLAMWDSWVGCSAKRLNFSLCRRAWLAHQNMGNYVEEKKQQNIFKTSSSIQTSSPFSVRPYIAAPVSEALEGVRFQAYSSAML